MTELESLRREIKRLKREKAQSEQKTMNAERVILSRNIALETYQTKLKSLVEERTRQLEEQAAIAEAASKAKSDFLARMSHEIRTPLNAIIGMSGLMRTDNFDSTQLRYFRDISSMSQNLLAIINDILDFSKIEAGKLTLEPVHYNLRELFEHIVSMCRFMAESKGLLFHAAFDRDLTAVVYGDDTRVRQVLVNIINNAIKYTQEGFVEFRLSPTERDGKAYITAVVRDSGRGIKSEDQEKLFGKFEQFDREKNRNIVGTGLGLAIAKQLVDMMGGTIAVESEYGSGSAFTVCFPLEPGDPALAASEAESAAPVRAVRSARVLVVDDMRVNLTVALGLLARNNIHADTADSGEEALRKAEALAESGGGAYDIIFMDHMMPEMDGLETTRRYRQWEQRVGRPKPVPVIAFSANAVQGARELFLSAGMNDFVSKPVQAVELNRVLRRWLPQEKIFQGPALPAVTPKPPASESPARPVRAGLGAEASDEAPAGGPPRDSPGARAGAGGAGGAASPGPSPFLAALSALCDIDVALEHLGDGPGALKGVTDFLTLFSADISGYMDTMRDTCIKKDWKNFAIAAHGFKGAFATMGNAGLSEEARRLEAAAKDGRASECEAGTEPFLKKLFSFREQLKAVLATLPEEAASVPESKAVGEGVTGGVDEGELRGMIESLAEAVRDSRGRETQRLMDAVDAALLASPAPPPWVASWRKIRPLLTAFDYPAAGELLEKILGQWAG